MQEISLCDISGIMTKAPCEAALMGQRPVRIEISDFIMRTFVLSMQSLLRGNRKYRFYSPAAKMQKFFLVFILF